MKYPKIVCTHGLYIGNFKGEFALAPLYFGWVAELLLNSIFRNLHLFFFWLKCNYKKYVKIDGKEKFSLQNDFF